MLTLMILGLADIFLGGKINVDTIGKFVTSAYIDTSASIGGPMVDPKIELLFDSD